MNPVEKIKEQRLIEATRKNYLGVKNGKFGTILRNLGTKIVGHSSPLFDSTPYIDPYDEEESDDLPTFDEEELTTDLGYLFDGLSRGVHLEIKYIDVTLTVHYKGYLVFMEKSGDLECFVPNDEWENKIEDLYRIAVKMQRETKKEALHNKVVKEEEAREGVLRHLLKTWGFRL